MLRIYDALLEEQYQSLSQMAFLAGPRQVGKTTISRNAQKISKNFHYLNWDTQQDRRLITKGAHKVAIALGLDKLSEGRPIVVFDEIHKYGRWKRFLKGFFDLYKDRVFIIVTGSSRLDIYKKGGDSLMGRYFLYHIHPISVAECVQKKRQLTEIQLPQKISDEQWQSLLSFGGFPEPFLRANSRFWHRWKRLRIEQLFREDIRDLGRVHELGQMHILAEVLRQQAGQLVVYTDLANEINISVDTVRRWIAILENFYYCFTIKPWFKNVSRSLRKQPKVYMWDWSSIDDPGARAENLVASHLLKAVHFWTDMGLGEYELFFLRDKNKREVDFLVAKNKEPWFLVEVKSSDNNHLCPNLEYFQQQTKAKHAFQVVFDMPYINKNCFDFRVPIIVPLKTFLSQLV